MYHKDVTISTDCGKSGGERSIRKDMRLCRVVGVVRVGAAYRPSPEAKPFAKEHVNHYI